jgi:hypothetical protein
MLLVMVVTVGCSPRTRIVLNRDLNAIVGKDIHVVIKKIGYPNSEAVMLGDKVYTWLNNDCTLHIVVDQTEHVTHFDYQGSRHECSRLADNLDES